MELHLGERLYSFRCAPNGIGSAFDNPVLVKSLKPQETFQQRT